ncbi:MAG: UDP-N-acetylglucosamine-1-phosphate transferase [Candidatus Altiarchaeota archaeon]|nr:UDP-N-acetylglucosamine-1-phosphate transferase [Candidatus Altiarchaeota archaeon]
MDPLIISSIMFFVGFFVTFLYTPRFIHKATTMGFVVMDMYKKGKPLIPNVGGLTILAGTLASLMAAQLLVPMDKILIFYFIVTSFALFGLADDLLNVGRPSKIYIPFLLSLPIAILCKDTTLSLGFMEVELSTLYAYLICPLYVMVVANLVNMHSGFNGLSVGLSTNLLIFIAAKAYLSNGVESLYYILPLFGSLIAFQYYDFYPAKILWGNVGSLMVGSAVGGLIVVNRLEAFGFVLLIPHIVNFLMYVVWKIKNLGDVKFGRVQEDGSLWVPNPWTLKWVLPYYFRVTEHQAMWFMYLLTTLFGVLAFVLVP